MADASAGSAGAGAGPGQGADGAEAAAGGTAGKRQRKTKAAGTAAAYTLHNPRTNATQQFADAREAGAAFFAAEPSNRPAVIHSTEGGGARLMATTEVHGAHEDGKPRFVKTLPSSHKGDAEFRAGYAEALERQMRQEEAKAKGAASPPQDKKPRAAQRSRVGQVASPSGKPVGEAPKIDASAPAAAIANSAGGAGGAGQDDGGSRGREVEAPVLDGKSVSAFGPDGNPAPSDVLAAAEDKPKRIRRKAKAGTEDQADAASKEKGESAKRKPRARKATAQDDDELLPNGIDAPAREGETKLAGGATAYVDQKFRTVAVEDGDKVYLLGGAAAVEKFAKQAQLDEKDGQALRDLLKQAFKAPADPYELEVLRRVAQLQRLRNQEVRSGSDLAQHEQPRHDEIRERSTPAAPTAQAKDAIPAELQRQYLKVANKFYHADRPEALAFVDKGERLETKSDSERTAGNLVAIAESRGWDSVKVSGSQAFRREVWLEASARGMLVRGYKAADVDRALLEQRVATGRSNAVERDEEAAKQQSQAAQRPEPAREKEGTSRPPKTASAADSEASRGTGNATRSSRGDRRSPQQISWPLPDHGRAGAQRNEWKVNVSEESKQVRREQAAEDFRTLPLQQAAKRHPDQLAAASVLAVATVLAREKFADNKAREQFLARARDRVAADLAAGQEIRAVQVRRTPRKEREKATPQQAPEPRVERLLVRSS